MAVRRTYTHEAGKAPGPLPSLSDREFLILRALQGNLRQGLYGIEIRNAVAEEFGVTLPWGSLYVMLGRLVEKGFAERIETQASGVEVRRQHYRLTANGAEALAAKASLLNAMMALGASRSRGGV